MRCFANTPLLLLGHHADKRIALSRIPTLFEELVQRGDSVVSAVETIVALLAGDHRE